MLFSLFYCFVFSPLLVCFLSSIVFFSTFFVLFSFFFLPFLSCYLIFPFLFCLACFYFIYFSFLLFYFSVISCRESLKRKESRLPEAPPKHVTEHQHNKQRRPGHHQVIHNQQHGGPAGSVPTRRPPGPVRRPPATLREGMVKPPAFPSSSSAAMSSPAAGVDHTGFLSALLQLANVPPPNGDGSAPGSQDGNKNGMTNHYYKSFADVER